MLIEKIRTPDDLKDLSESQMNMLCSEIRETLINTVAKNGGHLASNLGIVELTIALHRTFDFSKDKIIFDVGHQSYVHKIITGRFDRFSTLREYGGLSGFPKRDESIYDCFETGHASTSISAALGMARARDYLHQDHHVIAVVGDGALTGGMCYEALNDAGNSKTRMIVILNDNEMSIAKNTGALSVYLTNLRFSGQWQNAKSTVRHLNRVPFLGKPVYKILHAGKTLLKTALVKNVDIGFFEALGFEYFGPIDGHDLTELEKIFKMAKSFNGPCVIHVKTRKGYGYELAEKRPEAFHGTPPFLVETGDRIDPPNVPSCGHVMANTLAELADNDDRIVAITAAMKLGTGLDHFATRHPDKLLDVGIAEEHAATMAAGLAAGGMRPYLAVYSTFFQRCYDQMIHDVCMQNLPVVFLLDRSGIGGEDGKTHHGLFDFAELLPVPNMTVLSPCDSEELRQMISWTLTQNGPCAIRYSREGSAIDEHNQTSFLPGKWTTLVRGKDCAILAVGSMVRRALKVAEILHEKNIFVSVINCSSVKPIDRSVLETLQNVPYYTMEEHMLTGGFGAYIQVKCSEWHLKGPEKVFAVQDQFIPHGSHEQLICAAGLDEHTISETLLSYGGC